MTIPVKPLNEIQEKSEVSASDKILILDSVSEEARLAPKSELKWDKWDKGDTWAKWATWSKWDKWDTGETWATIVGATFSWNDIVFGKDDWSYITLTDAKTTLKWPKWDTWNSSTISVGTTSTGNPWTDASVTNSWTSSAAVLNFTIPQGQVWATGNWIESITHSKSWKVTTVVITETNWDTSSFEILDGKDWNSWAWSGDVVWPEGATDWHLAVYDWNSWKLIKDGWAVPTVRNSKIEIQKNGTKVWDFTLNQASNKTIDISVPTKTSDLSNDSGFITGISSGDVTTALGYTPANSASLWTASTKNTWTSSWNVPVLDSNWKLATSTLPWVALTDTFTVSTSSDLTSLSSADQWDIAIVTSENKTYVLSVAPYSTASNWKEILAPTGWVTSFNWQTWAVTYTAPVSSVNGSTWAVTVLESQTKVFPMPAVWDNISDLVSWLSAGKTAVLFAWDDTPWDRDGQYYQIYSFEEWIWYMYCERTSPWSNNTVEYDISYDTSTYIVQEKLQTVRLFAPTWWTNWQVLTYNNGSTSWQTPSGWDVVVSSQTGNILQSWMKIWAGTETNYWNLGTYDSNTLYLTVE